MNVGKSLFLATCFFFLLIGATHAQKKSKAALEKEKKENLQKIKEAEKILKETENKKKVSVGQLNALNQQIKAREGLIRSMRKEILLLEEEMAETNSIVESLEGDLGQLRKEYASMAYAAHKANQSFDQLVFLFSSDSFNQLMMRLKYMKQYSDARKNQAREINEVKNLLGKQMIGMQSKRLEKDTLLSQQLVESKNLDKLKKKQNTVVRSLEDKEKNIKDELAANKRALARLDNLIGNLIKSEIAKAAKVTKTKAKDKIPLTPEGSKLSSSFEGARSKLGWPVSSGFITQKYGKQKHPTLKGILINNNGVNIQTNQNENVRSVFNGEVVRVASVAGMGNVVVVKHGEYFTLYAKMKRVLVKKGQVVNADQSIGTVLTDKDGVAEVHFEIWKNAKKQDPELWLSRK